MKTQKILLLVAGIVFLFLFADIVHAVTGEEALFVSAVQPDALILLDLSGSMAWNPAGDDMVYGSTDSCYPDYLNCGCSGCSGGYCSSSQAARTCYASDSCGTPDTSDCVGTGCSNGYCSSAQTVVTFYAASSCTTANYTNCIGTTCGRTDGYCNNPQTAGTTYYAHSSSCSASTTYCKNTETIHDCANGYCASSHSNCSNACTSGACNHTCTTGHDCSIACTAGACSHNCSRLNIAKRSIFNILDDNNDGTINTIDEGSLAVRLGYMRFYNCNGEDTGGYSSGCCTLIKGIGSSYSSINTSVQSESANGGTPLASSLNEARLYLNDNKAADAAKACRQKFVILITDGSDTFACGADGSECDSDRYQNRRAVVARAKALSDAGYNIFVIGFGAAMPPYLKNTLNWMAYYGGTDNPNDANSGSTSAYNLPTGCRNDTPVTSACCSDSNLSACYPSGVSSCQTASSTMTAACYDSDQPYPTTSGNSTSAYRATSNDPGYLDLSGYAFLAEDADQLVAAVKAAISIIREATYSFSQASIQSSRTADENFVYEGSFQPVNGDPFWPGHLRKYQINTDGSVGSMLYDAGDVLQGTAYTARNIKTCIGCAASYTTPVAMTAFSNSITPSYFNVTAAADVNAIVGYIQGNVTYNPDNWKLGDVFRSTPITFGKPSSFFEDYRDANNAYDAYRSAHDRTSALGNRIIVAGANEGQLHAFKTSDMTEAWSFIPPNLLSKLKNITHTVDPSALVHQYFVDGPVSGADAWLGSGDGKSKSSGEWRTLLVFGEGRGSTDRLWSSSAYCDSGLNGTYSSTYTQYCGYYALDVTDTLNPLYRWRLNTFNATTQAPYMGESWSKMIVGRVLTKSGSTETEKWVGFIGGGYNANNCTGTGTCDTRGKGFFIVDLSNGHILWSLTHSDNGAMDYSFAAPPALVDTDSDGFIDTVYIGDLGGNMWRFKLCTKSVLDASGCATSDWRGDKFYNASSSGRPIYTSATAAKDDSGNIWVFWGTGDKVDPTSTTSTDYFYAVKDDRTSTLTSSNLTTITTAAGVFDPTSTTLAGYRIQMLGTGEKILGDPTVYGGVAYYTSFVPGDPNDPCYDGGDAYLNAVYFNTGLGGIVSSGRQVNIGSGIASSPIVSMAPIGGGGPIVNLYVTVSGGGATGASTQKINFNMPGLSQRTNLLFWRDRRIE